MKTAIGLLRLFIRNSQVRIQQEMQYRANYISGVIVSIAFSIFPAIFQYLVFTQTKGFPGWNLQQIILFQGMLLVVVGMRNTLFGSIQEVVANLIYKGDFDRILLKPYPPIGTIMASGFTANSLGTLLTGLFIVIYTGIRMGLSISLFQFALVAICIVFGLLFFASINIMYCSIAIMIVYMGGIWDLIESVLNVSTYPKEIFPKIVQTVFLTMVPFLVMVYFPAQVLLNRAEISIIYSFIAVILFFAASLIFWGRCLKKYTSAGG